METRSKSCAKTAVVRCVWGPYPARCPGPCGTVASAAALRRCLGATWARRRGERKVRLSLEPLRGRGAQEQLDIVFSLLSMGWWSQGAGPEGLSRGQLESVGRGRSLCAAPPAPTDGPVSPGPWSPPCPWARCRPQASWVISSRPKSPMRAGGLSLPPRPSRDPWLPVSRTTCSVSVSVNGW